MMFHRHKDDKLAQAFNDTEQKMLDMFGPVIHEYSRAEALADGTLVDVMAEAEKWELANPIKCPFKWHVAMTATVWHEFVQWDNDEEHAYQDESGRLWDVLFMAYMGAKKNPDASEIEFPLSSVPHGKQKGEEKRLRLVISGGDNGEPVMTIMLTNED